MAMEELDEAEERLANCRDKLESAKAEAQECMREMRHAKGNNALLRGEIEDLTRLRKEKGEEARRLVEPEPQNAMGERI